MIFALYTLLHGLGTESQTVIDEFDLNADPDVTGGAFDVLSQKPDRNLVEQRFLDKVQGEAERVQVRDVPELEKTDDSPSLYQSGGLLDTRDAQIVYETEDGEVITGFNEDEYEVVEEYEEITEEIEADPDDEDYEYVWVEEEVEVDEQGEIVAPPYDEFRGSDAP
jgi:hypothetical protein